MNYDVIVIGAGPAGLSFVRALSGSKLKVAVIEKVPEYVLMNPPYDGREIALTHLSQKIMTELGQWDKIPECGVSLIRHAKVLNGDSPYALHFDQKESGKENLGFMVSNHLIRKAAYEAITGADNVTFLHGNEVTAVSTDQRGARVVLSDGQQLSASLVVAADSRFSTTRRMMGITVDMLDFGRTCIVCKMDITGDHEQTAFECFYFDRTLAVLPLGEKEVSIVITLGTNESESVLGESPQAFADDIERRTQGRFGKMTLKTKLYPYPLVATYARKFYAERFALIGDAAVGMHPVTAHGFNLGLRGAYVLAEEIKKSISCGGDFSSQSVLESYHRKHRRVSRPIYLGTNALVSLYTKQTPSAKLVRGGLLRAGNLIKPAKRLIMNQLTEARAR